MEAAPQHNVNDDSNNNAAVTRTHSNKEAPFTVDDLQSELSSIPNLSETHKSSVTPSSQPATNVSGLDAENLSPSTHDTSQARLTSDAAAAAAAAHSDIATSPANSAEGAEGHSRVVDAPPTGQAEQKPLQSPSADAQSQLNPSAADASTASSAAQSAMPGDVGLSSEQLNMHVSEQQGDSSWASDAFPGDTTDVEAPAPTGGTEARTKANNDADLEGSSAQAQGQLECGDTADGAEGYQASTKDAAHEPSTAAGSHTSTDQSEPPMETQANDSDWAAGGFAEAPASVNTDTPSDGDSTEVPASGDVELLNRSNNSQHSPVMPKEPQANDSHWADDAFAAEQSTLPEPSAETQAAVIDVSDPHDSGALGTAASSEPPSIQLSASDAELPSSAAAAREADTAAAGKASTAAGINKPEQPGEQQVDEDDWGDDDDFGDFNDAGNDDDDGGFGAFNEAVTGTPRSADASVQSPESHPQAPQPSAVSPVPQELPQPSLLSRLLNATQQDLPSMLKQIADPLTALFATLPPLTEVPLNPDGSHSRWRYNGQGLLEYHMQQAKKLRASDVLPTAGLLGQPQAGGSCPAAPSLTRSKVTATGWQGSRGDVRLLARLGLSQAGLQDERDAQEKALAAKNRWRRKSSTNGLMPVRSSGPPTPQGGPLSYLSTLTTASPSEWGSQSLDNLSKQPSDVASAGSANPVASTSAAEARAASSMATSSGQRGGGNDSGYSRQELGRKLSSADQSLASKDRANSRSSRASAEASETVNVGNSSQAQGPDRFSKPPGTALQAQVSGNGSGSAALPPDGLKQTTSPSGSQFQRQGPNADSAAQYDAAAADWSAFGGAAKNEADSHQSQHVPASQTASAHQSGHALPSPSTRHASAAEDEWSAFGEPSSASFDAAPSSLDDSTMEAAQAGAGFDNTNSFLEPGEAPTQQGVLAAAGYNNTNPFQDPGQALTEQVVQPGVSFNNTNPFLDPGQDLWQQDTQAVPADTAEVARTASGDSFGDFNAPGEREDGFEVGTWDAAAVPEDMTDRTAAVASADPFAASASFTDFAALLERNQTDLLGSLDTMASLEVSPQAPSAAQSGLTELQGDVGSGLQQSAQNSEPLQGFGKQLSGYASPEGSRAMQQREVLVAGILVPDLSFMLTSDLRPDRT